MLFRSPAAAVTDPPEASSSSTSASRGLKPLILYFFFVTIFFFFLLYLRIIQSMKLDSSLQRAHFSSSTSLFSLFFFCNDLHCDALVSRQQCPAEALPLPQGIPLKSMIQNLRRKVCHLTKKSKKMDDKLHKLRKSHSEATVEVTRL